MEDLFGGFFADYAAPGLTPKDFIVVSVDERGNELPSCVGIWTRFVSVVRNAERCWCLCDIVEWVYQAIRRRISTKHHVFNSDCSLLRHLDNRNENFR